MPASRTSPSSPVEQRRRLARQSMRQTGLYALIVTDPNDLSYLTGFRGEDSVLLLTAGRAVLVTDSRFTEQARRECPQLTIHTRAVEMVEAVIRTLFQRATGQGTTRAATANTRAIGIDANTISHAVWNRYRKRLGRSLRPANNLLAPLRERKDRSELGSLGRAVRVAEDALTATRACIVPGVSERAVAARLEYEMAVRGSSCPAFPTIVAFGGHAAEPHAIPQTRRLRRNDTVLIDWGATVEGYRSDLTRCFCVGRIPRAFSQAYARVLQAQTAAIEAIRPGRTLAEIDRVAREPLGSDPAAFRHGTGHGIGLHVHEKPVVWMHNNDPLQQGMVLTIEPGYYVPGRFGIRIEDDVLVTDRGYRVLSRLPKGVDQLRLTPKGT